MTMAFIWTGMVCLSVLCGLATGRGPEVAAAAVEGAAAAVELCLSIAGMLCLWTGVMEIMRRSGQRRHAPWTGGGARDEPKESRRGF